MTTTEKPTVPKTYKHNTILVNVESVFVAEIELEYCADGYLAGHPINKNISYKGIAYQFLYENFFRALPTVEVKEKEVNTKTQELKDVLLTATEIKNLYNLLGTYLV